MFKKDMFHKSSFNWGMRLMLKGLIEPSLKLGFAAIKDLSSRERTVKTTPNHYDFSIREKGLLQCDNICNKAFEILKLNPNSTVFQVVEKLTITANKYFLISPYKTNVDFYSFANQFFYSQAEKLKTEKSKKLYNSAAKVLPLFISDASNDEIIEFITNDN